MKRFSVFTIMFSIVILVFGCSSESKTLNITPTSLKFGDVNLGEFVTQDITLTNKYGKLLLITAIGISGSNDYTITAGNILPINLDKNATHTVTVKFEPTSGGPLVALLSVLHDASTKARDVDLTGNGIPVARIELSDTTYDFSKKIINRTHSHNLDIENIGTSDLEINNLSFVGLGAPVYSISAGGPTPIYVTPGTTKTITITFEPIVIGNYPANLEMYHNAVNENSPIIYPIIGEGIDVDPQITLSQTSPWDFGTVATTKPSIQICEIENTGIDPLTVTSATFATGTEFSVDSLKDSNGNVINFPQVIAVGAKIMLAIKFAPTSNVIFNDTMTLIHDGTNEVSPWDISVTGEGRIIVTETFNNIGVDNKGSIQSWTVPAGVTLITIEAWGAEGGGGTYSAGKGARMKGDFIVTPGAIVKIVVGHKGDIARYSSGTPGGGGGGGSFVWLDASPNMPLIAAGGGGGGSSGSAGLDGSISESGGTPSGGGAGGTGGQGGANCTENCAGAGGAGWLTDGGSQSCAGSYMNYGGKTKMSFEGGYSTYTSSGGGSFGGYGGGGGALRGGAGGGGYSGGGGGKNSNGQGGGGGGSYNSGTSPSNTAGVQTGHGKVVIEY